MSSKSLRLRDQPIGKREVRREGLGGWLCCTNKEELIQVDNGYEGPSHIILGKIHKIPCDFFVKHENSLRF